MIYVVSGFMRTGTSMMMRALIEGGLEAHYGDRSRLNQTYGDEHYTPNEEYFEPEPAEFLDLDFPTAHKGKLIKVLYGGLVQMKPHKYRVIFMMRNPIEIRQSIMGFFQRDYVTSKQQQMLTEEMFPRFMGKHIDLAKNRKDVVSFHQFDYRSVVEDPYPYFKQLKDAGWPINPLKASKVPCHSFVRYKTEELEVNV